MSSLHTTAVVERLSALDAQGYETAAQVHHYVVSGHESRPTTEALLTAIRLDDKLALEVRDSMGRDVIGALTDDHGVVRYPLWSHSAVAAKAGIGDVQTRSIERYRAAANALEDRRPRVVLREATVLSDLEAPDDWGRVDGPKQLREGP